MHDMILTQASLPPSDPLYPLPPFLPLPPPLSMFLVLPVWQEEAHEETVFQNTTQYLVSLQK